MTDKLQDVWSTRDFPVLAAIARQLESGEDFLFEHPISAETGLTREQVIRAVVALNKAHFIEVQINEAAGGVLSVAVTGITERGMRQVGLWPSADEAADRLIAALNTLAEQAPTEDERNRWQKVRDGVLGASRDMVVGVATAVITGQLPGQNS